jgi:hypothetical protein
MSSVVKGIVTLFSALMVAAVFAALFSNGVHLRPLGIGDNPVCVTDSPTTVGGGGPALQGLKPAPGATVDTDAHPRYCTDDPTAAQGLLNIATQVPGFVFVIGALLLVLRLIRNAEGADLYTARTAERLRTLGWWLLAGSVIAAIATSVAEQALVDSLSRNGEASASMGLLAWDIPYMAILTGLGVLSFARIMRIGVTMREELDGTV